MYFIFALVFKNRVKKKKKNLSRLNKSRYTEERNRYIYTIYRDSESSPNFGNAVFRGYNPDTISFFYK